jgi:membrane-bound lytic murein transglycosylase A
MRPPAGLEPLAWDRFPAPFDMGALDAFRRSARRLVDLAPEQRIAVPPLPGLSEAACAALDDTADPDRFFRRWFRPFAIPGPGFVTAYYEPEIEARRIPSPDFATPVLSRPRNLVTLDSPIVCAATGENLSAAWRGSDGSLFPFPARAEIETAAHDCPALAGARPLAYLRDPVELFLLQVQGSGRLIFPDGETAALTYDGRNGWPYSSVGRLLIARGIVSEAEMSLDRLKAALREMNVAPDAPGRRLMQENRSYVFFRIDESQERQLGPIGGSGCVLTPMRSIAVDRNIWCYGLPFFISTCVPWRETQATRLERLMIAQDTGSAIIGPARADLFFGAGSEAGRLAGSVRHAASFVALLPEARAAS